MLSPGEGSIMHISLKIFSFVLFLSLTCATAHAAGHHHSKTKQERRALRKARNYSLKGEYDKARAEYTTLVGIDSSNFEYNFELGMNYYYNYDNKQNAIKYLEAALRHSKKDTVGELFFYLADAYQFNNRYDDAIRCFSRMNAYIKNDEDAEGLKKDVEERIAQCNRAKEFAAHMNDKIHIEGVGDSVNTAGSEYVPISTDDDVLLMFTGREPGNTGGKTDQWDEKYFEDMFISRKENNVFDKPEKFTLTDKFVAMIPNSKKHDAVVSLSLDERKLITYKKNKLWISELKGTEWTTPVPLPETINNSKYQPHASLSNDGRTIYFTSDKEEDKHGLDIYSSTLSLGTWSTPVLMGPEINSDKDEDSPNISADGKTLYFSSKGRNTMGGYDIFRSRFDSVSGKWSEAENMGMPINSTGDDIFYKPNSTGLFAYFASYRPEGKGDMDIYRQGYEKKKDFENCLTSEELKRVRSLIYFNILSKDTITVKKGGAFEMTSLGMGKLLYNGCYWKIENDETADSNAVHHTFNTPGTYPVKLQVFGVDREKMEQVSLCISKEIKVLPVDETILVINGTLNKDSLKNMNQNNLPDLGLQRIFYDFDKYGLRKDAKETLDKNIAILLQHPEVVIKVSANTDSRGSKRYNKMLSEKRARYAVHYMEKHGIPKNRIIAVISNGEEDLINKCGNGEKCSNSDHAVNRRTEFIVVATK